MDIDLRPIKNDECISGCNPKDRSLFAQNGYCWQTGSVLDNEGVRCVGRWERDKIYFLLRYFQIFARGMSRKWAGKLWYVEIGTGPGRCIVRSEMMEIDGTSLAVVRDPEFSKIGRALFVDFDPGTVEILKKRIEAIGKTHVASACVGDYQNPREIVRLLDTVDPGGLGLVFIDPTDCSVPFSTIRSLKDRLNRFDLIINVATMTDFNRNIKTAVEKPKSIVRQKYSDFLGDATFFDDQLLIKAIYANDYLQVRTIFRDAYARQLGSIGLRHVDSRTIEHYYSLTFASAHPRGLDFWKKAARTLDQNGQRMMNFED